MIDKEELKSALIGLLEQDLATAVSAHAATEAGATHEEAKPENDKDTRALEQSYLARGQAARVEELRVALGQARTIPTKAVDGGPAALGAVVTAEEDGRTQHFYLAPGRGGAMLTAEGGSETVTVQVVTLASPLGRGLLGKRAGDDCEIRVGPRVRALTITSVE